MGTAKKRLKPRPPKLRKPTKADVPAMYAMYSDPRIWWNQSGDEHPNMEYTNAVLEQWLSGWRYDALDIWVACKQNTFIGTGGVRRCGNAWHLQYCVKPEYWHQGYGTYIAVSGVKAAAYFDKTMPVFLTMLRDNYTSRLIANRLGFRNVRNDFDPKTGMYPRQIFANRPITDKELRDYLDALHKLKE